MSLSDKFTSIRITNVDYLLTMDVKEAVRELMFEATMLHCPDCDMFNDLKEKIKEIFGEKLI